MRYSICFFITAFFLFGCHSKSSSSKENTVQNETPKYSRTMLKPLKQGIVIDSVFCADDSSQIYAVYLPTKYDTLKKWPIIYFFDPHGVGNLPILLYKDLAEKYGFILAGTYNSKNGMQWENSEMAARAFIKDTRLRFSLDNSRLYSCGFSGGAMVASMVAISDGGIAGVITCGGSMPSDHPLKQPFSYISFVGDKDFHYVSVKQLDKALDSSPLAHQLIVFNGKHQWPPASSLEKGFQWLDVDAMRMKTMQKNDSIIKSIREQFINEADEWHKKGNAVQEYYAYKMLLNFLRKIDDVDKYSDKVKQLENSEPLKKYFKEEESLEADESQKLDEFRAHLSQMDKSWWDGKISEMKKLIEKEPASPASLQTQRLFSYLSLVMYMQASGEFNNRNYPAASYFVELYAMVDPENPEHSYLSACLDMTDHNSAKALQMLQNAVKLGFSDVKRLQKDSNFVSLHDAPEFKNLLNEIASRPEKLDMTK